MGKIKKLPSLKRIRRVLSEIKRLPEYMDTLRQNCADINTLKTQSEALTIWNQDRMNEIHDLSGQIERLRDLQVDATYLKRLNWMLSSQTTLWGSEDRLHISELAALPGCMLNTNSGHITVGDYTFCGSRVSILAGSHDKELRGLLRRDVELTEGCDIQIGKGVWLASNCTILGPAVIEDDAVIAAGAVVVPGTHVAKGTIYAGVPARQVSVVDLENDTAEKKALCRNGGVLFSNGWSEKKEIVFEGSQYIGHRLLEKSGEILLDKASVRLMCIVENGQDCVVEIQYAEKTDKCDISNGMGEIFLTIDKKEVVKSEPIALKITVLTEVTSFFVAVAD